MPLLSGKAEEGASQDAKAELKRGERGTRAQTRTPQRPYPSWLLEMRGMESSCLSKEKQSRERLSSEWESGPNCPPPRGGVPPEIFNHDQGSQFTSTAFTARLHQALDYQTPVQVYLQS
jgi:hypothetical protein